MNRVKKKQIKTQKRKERIKEKNDIREDKEKEKVNS